MDQLWAVASMLALATIGILVEIEPKQSVWFMAAFGSFGAVLRGPKRKPGELFLYWLVGIGFSISFVIGVGRFQPESEAFFAGLLSGEGIKFLGDRLWPAIMQGLVSKGIK